MDEDCKVMQMGEVYVVALSYRALQFLHHAAKHENEGCCDLWEIVVEEALGKLDVG